MNILIQFLCCVESFRSKIHLQHSKFADTGNVDRSRPHLLLVKFFCHTIRLGPNVASPERERYEPPKTGRLATLEKPFSVLYSLGSPVSSVANAMKSIQVVLLSLLLSTLAQGFVILPRPSCHYGPPSASAAGLVPEQAEELEAYYECECELKRQHDEQETALLTSAQGRRPIVDWCRRVWNGVGRNEEVRFRRQTSSTSAHKHHSTSAP